MVRKEMPYKKKKLTPGQQDEDLLSWTTRTSAKNRNFRYVAILNTLWMLLILSSCYPLTETPPTANVQLVSPVSTEIPCEVCDQATLVAEMSIEQVSLEDQELATAKVVGANAQATLDSVNATLTAAQVQDENDAAMIAAQIAATAELARANAKATLSAAGSTLSAALTQDAIEQTRVQYNLHISEDLATEDAIVMGTQDSLIAIQNATTTQSAAETSQWYTAKANQLEKERQGPITFLWTWCLPPFIVLMGCLVLWGFWRWLKLQQEQIIKDQQANSPPIPKREKPNNRLRVTKPDYLQVNRWIIAIKKTLRKSEEEDNVDITN